MDTHVVILAAGKGTRMKSAGPKVLHHVAGMPMIAHVLTTARSLAPKSTAVVVGHGADAVRSGLTNRPDVTFVVQEPQLGTAHALLTTEPVLKDARGTLLLLYGDVPLLSAETLGDLLRQHQQTGAAATLITAILDDPYGYGRIVRSGEQIARIVEERDASEREREICEINSGIYAFALEGLFEAIRSIGAENAQKEYYLPDLVSIFRKQGRGVETVGVPDANEILGINSRAEIAAVSYIVRQTKNTELMAAGVTIDDPATTYIDADVQVGPDTVIRPGVTLERGSVVGAGCEIHSGVRVINSRVGNRVTIHNHCVIADSEIEDDASVGPFAHLRNRATIESRAKVGNFVEVKKTRVGSG